MKKNNLDVAPTEQELKNEGFKKLLGGLSEGWYTKPVQYGKPGTIAVKNNSCRFWIGTSFTTVECTKKKINDIFKLFNQPVLKWETKLKVGEVYSSGDNTFFFVQWVKGSHVTCVNLAPHHESFGANITSFDGYKKVANSLEEYYKKEFSKDLLDGWVEG